MKAEFEDQEYHVGWRHDVNSGHRSFWCSLGKNRHLTVNEALEHKMQRDTFYPENDIPWTHKTTCTIWVNSTPYIGVAHCSEKDQFSRSKGRKLSMARAMELFDRDIRCAIWNVYKYEIGLTK